MKRKNIIERHECSKSQKVGCRWIYTGTSSLQELLTELTMLCKRSAYEKGETYGCVELNLVPGVQSSEGNRNRPKLCCDASSCELPSPPTFHQAQKLTETQNILKKAFIHSLKRPRSELHFDISLASF